MRINKMFYNITLVFQVIIFSLECLSFLLLLVINPEYFKAFIVNSRISLNWFNQLFFNIYSVFQSVNGRIIAGGLLILFFSASLIYFLFVEKIWQRPCKSSLIFTGLIFLTTACYCFVVLNFWQFYSNFM